MTKLFQLLASGAALGAIYALVCLGFVVIYRATGVINFAQAGIVVLGAFLTYNASQTWNLGFFGGLIVAALLGGLLGILIERLVLRRMVGQPVYALLLVTVGVLLMVSPIVTTIWRNPPPTLATPFKLDKFEVFDVQITWLNTVTVVIGAVVVIGFFLFFQYTKYGVAMRATAVDQEAALMQGINVNFVIALSWAIAGIVAVLGGAMLAAGAGPGVGLGVGIGIIALKALPAMVLGGLDSPGGAVVGGLAIGIAEVMTKGYQSSFGISWLENPAFARTLPWIIMLAVLFVRPYGLFGTRQVQRL